MKNREGKISKTASKYSHND